MRSQGFLVKHSVEPKETVDAKAKLGRETALQLAEAASTVIVAKGKKVVRFDMRKDRPSDEDLLGHMLGTTGNLRAPTLKSGKTLVVGFHEDVYGEEIG